MQQKVLLWFTALAVAIGSMAGLAVQTARAEVAAQPIVISAVQVSGGDGFVNQDFIELYNPNPYPMDLNGHRLVKRSANGTADSSIKSFSAETIIPAYSFYLWANSSWLDIAVVPDATTSATLANDNGVALRQGALDTGTIIDSLAWGETSNGFVTTGLSNPSGAESVVRQDLFENLGYFLASSSPRNSNVQVLPDQIPELTDNAQCGVENHSVQVAPGQSLLLNLNLVNLGNTVWGSSNYFVQQNYTSSELRISLGKDVNPLEQITLALTLSAPVQIGEYFYQWQMNSGVQLFGEVCSMTVMVQVEVPDDQPDSQAKTVQITEFLPNPIGEDNGFEVVELHNFGNTVINLENWVLDDVLTAPLSSNAFVLGNQTLGAGEYVAIRIPSGKFGLNNSGGDGLGLFDQQGELISKVTYTSTAPEGKSYSLIGGSWYWSAPSLGSVNLELPSDNPDIPDDSDDEAPPVDPEPDDESVNYELIISEIYPAPKPAQKEFVEIYNPSVSLVNLSAYKLVIGSRAQVLPDVDLGSGEYFILTGQDLKLPLADSGKLIQLQSLSGEIIDEVEYPKALKGSSYAWAEDSYVWTLTPTPGQANQLTLSGEARSSKAKPAKKTVPAKVAKQPIAGVSETNQDKFPQEIAPALAPPAQQPKANIINAIAIGFASLSAGVYALYKFGIAGL